VDDVAIKRVDTAMTPCDAGSYGSRVTDLAGQAAMKAAEDVRRQLADFAAGMWQVSPEDIEFKNHRVFVKSSPEKSIDFRKLTQAACYSEAGMVIMGKGYSQVGIEVLDFDRGYGNCGTSYSFTSHLTEVDVDLETGFTKATNFLIAHDCGHPLNPMTVESQCEGGAVQGLGQALYEEFKMDHGFTRNANLCDYKMPLSMDVPDIETVHIITEDPLRPYGAKEASEGSTVSSPPSIISAIHNATGIWFKSQPVTPEKIVTALREKRDKEGKP
jgi:4-hydroxybenzoyl-CoA reductase subunit alpha